MAEVELGIQAAEPYQGLAEAGWARNLVERTLAVTSFAGPAEVSLVLTDDPTIRELNRQYRGLDEVTDVLSFSFVEQSQDEKLDGAFVAPPDGVSHLGEVVISYPRAAAQAGQDARSTREELALLLVHGVLHLLGYDHEEPAAARQMRALEQRALSGLE